MLPFEPKLAVYITERQWHPSQDSHMWRDGRIEMRFETTGHKHPVVQPRIEQTKLRVFLGRRETVCARVPESPRSG
jgi:hypothetical protein